MDSRLTGSESLATVDMDDRWIRRAPLQTNHLPSCGYLDARRPGVFQVVPVWGSIVAPFYAPLKCKIRCDPTPLAPQFPHSFERFAGLRNSPASASPDWRTPPLSRPHILRPVGLPITLLPEAMSNGHIGCQTECSFFPPEKAVEHCCYFEPFPPSEPCPPTAVSCP